VKFYTFITCL